MSKKMTSAPSWVFILILFSLLIGLIVYLMVKKTGQFGYFISREAKAARLKLTLINWGIFLGGIGSIFVFINRDDPTYLIAFPVASVVSLILYFAKIRVLYPAWIDDRTVGVRGIRPVIMIQLVEASINE